MQFSPLTLAADACPTISDVFDIVQDGGLFVLRI